MRRGVAGLARQSNAGTELGIKALFARPLVSAVGYVSSFFGERRSGKIGFS